MTDQDRARAKATTVDPSRHEGAESGAKGDPTGLDFDEVMEIRAKKNPVGLLASIFKAFGDAAKPKDRPNVVQLGDDEDAHRLMSNAALAALAESIDRLIGKLPERVEIAPSDRITFNRTAVGTGSPATRLVSRQPDRVRVRIRNREASGGNSIFLGTGPGLTTNDGFELPGASEIEIETRAEIYAVAETATVGVDLVIEFGDLKS